MGRDRRVRHQHGRRARADRQARCRSDDRDEQRGWADGEEIAHRQVETDLEQEQQHPDARQDVEVRIGAKELEFPETGKVPEHHAGQELSEDGRLADTYRKVSAEHGGRDDDREAQGKPSQFVERPRTAARKRQSAAEQESGGGHQHELNDGSGSHQVLLHIMEGGGARSIEIG